jgi:GGDEF domain-containing protein
MLTPAWSRPQRVALAFASRVVSHGAMPANLRLRILLTLATLVLVGFCAWTAGLLVAIQGNRRSLRQRVHTLDAVELVQDQVLQSARGGEVHPEAWVQSVAGLEHRVGLLVPGGCGPELTRAAQLALVRVDLPVPPSEPVEVAAAGGGLLALTAALRAESASASSALDANVGSLFTVALGAILLAMTTLLASWWVLRSREQLERMGERLARQARVDYLTGVWNRRMVIGLLEREIVRAARSGLPTAVILYDLDHFKRINDTLGHPAGDRALVDVSATVSRLLRGYDVLGRLGTKGEAQGQGNEELVGRYGGEEFLVVLPGHGLEDGMLVAERLRAAIAALDTLAAEGAHITASFGVAASMAGAAVEANELIQAADSALYQAKEAGRDRVEAHSALLEGPIWS